MESQAVEVARKAAEGFGVLQCRECCERIQQALSDAGLEGRLSNPERRQAGFHDLGPFRNYFQYVHMISS